MLYKGHQLIKTFLKMFSIILLKHTINAKSIFNAILIYVDYYSLLFQLGYELKDEEVDSLFLPFKAMAEKKKVKI